ncbi:MAG: heterodisulfide reductase-related iron-sulfur binding cluster [Chloroflexota bacterium]|nr:heterodisulfide reductase-related iron-sulfur binding cluster [Chloroflexota bacterium]
MLGVPFYPLIVAPVAVATFLFWRRLRLHLSVVRMGRPLNRNDRPWERVKGIAIYVLAQKRLLRDIGPGVMHALIFWGFLVLLATTGNYVTNGLVELVVGWPLGPGGPLWWLAIFGANMFMLLVLASIGFAAYRRLVVKPRRLTLSRDALLILALIAGVVTTELLGDAFGYAIDPADRSRPFAILAGPLSLPLEALGVDIGRIGFGVFAWLHIGFVLGFLAYLPYSKHLHIFTSEANVWFRNVRPRGELRKLDLEAEPVDGKDPVFGARTLPDLTWRHLFDGLVCTECGRCTEFCPASMTGKVLSPKHFMEGLRDQIVATETALAAAASAQRAAKAGASGGAEAADHALQLARERAKEALELPIVDTAIPYEAVWQCTTCGWCVEGCPVLIEHVDSIVELRRNMVLEESRFPKELGAAFRNMENAGNPWGQPRSARLDWAKGLDVSVLGGEPTNGAHPSAFGGDRILLWVGCAGAFDDRNRRVIRAVAQLLRQADVPFSVLGPKETCSGDPARRAGNEYLYQMLAEENVATLSAAHDEHGISTIVATCPHCFNTIRHEYPQFGLAGVEVVHHTEFLAQLVDDGRLVPMYGVGESAVAFHDACYLGRYNGVYDAPRDVVEAVPGQHVVEMSLHHDRGMCCGAGGARMWMEEREGERINHRRAKQALALEPEAIATACPYCLIMLRDGTTDLQRTDVPVRDVAEMLADATGAWTRPALPLAARAPEQHQPGEPAAEVAQSP